MKIALGQINTTVGALRENCRKIEDVAGDARSAGADLVLFPECSIPGYPPKDLLDVAGFVDENVRELHQLAARIHGIDAVVGFVEPNPEPQGKPFYNAAAIIHDGKVASIHRKSLLPTYDVFDEDSYFEPSRIQETTTIEGVRVGVTICEDVWNDRDSFPRRLYHLDPVQIAVQKGAEYVINISASPYHLDKWEERHNLLQREAQRYKKFVVYLNLVGANDEVIFDGRSVIFSPDGEVVARARDFEEDLLVYDLESNDRIIRPSSANVIENARKALVLGIRDYVRKCGFSKITLGLSGGIDSAVACALAVEAAGAENVLGVLMPSQYSSEHSITDALALAKNLGIRTEKISIAPIFDAYREELRPVFKQLPEDVTEENLQSRIRGALLMAISNKYGRLVLSTGNKSELAVGYSTLYGDSCGGLAPISDVPKTMVYKLAEHINRDAEIIPKNSIAKPPSAELRPNQKDSDSLPEYEVLDAILLGYIEDHLTVDQIVKQTGFDEQLVREVILKVDRAEYKRKQFPIGLKITSKAFGFGRRMPIAQRYNHPV
jgi:NAD+ synthase (glutamine-hydrolysing)